MGAAQKTFVQKYLCQPSKVQTWLIFPDFRIRLLFPAGYIPKSRFEGPVVSGAPRNCIIELCSTLDFTAALRWWTGGLSFFLLIELRVILVWPGFLRMMFEWCTKQRTNGVLSIEGKARCSLYLSPLTTHTDVSSRRWTRVNLKVLQPQFPLLPMSGAGDSVKRPSEIQVWLTSPFSTHVFWITLLVRALLLLLLSLHKKPFRSLHSVSPYTRTIPTLHATNSRGHRLHMCDFIPIKCILRSTNIK